jgi:hypothetical protein
MYRGTVPRYINALKSPKSTNFSGNILFIGNTFKEAALLKGLLFSDSLLI